MSTEKTRITPLSAGFELLGHRVRIRWGRFRGAYTSLEIPKEKVRSLEHRVKRLTERSTTSQSLAALLRQLNPLLRGWANFYRHCYGASRVFSRLDWYVWNRIWRWLRKKHPHSGARALYARFCRQASTGRRQAWAEGGIELCFASRRRVARFRLGSMSTPDFAKIPGEPDA